MDASSNRVPKYGMLGHLLCPETSAPCDGTKPGCCGANAIPKSAARGDHPDSDARAERLAIREDAGSPGRATRNRVAALDDAASAIREAVAAFDGVHPEINYLWEAQERIQQALRRHYEDA